MRIGDVNVHDGTEVNQPNDKVTWTVVNGLIISEVVYIFFENYSDYQEANGYATKLVSFKATTFNKSHIGKQGDSRVAISHSISRDDDSKNFRIAEQIGVNHSVQNHVADQMN